MSGYERPAAAAGMLRLHLNENTAGCSPQVVDALGGLSAEDVAFYPEYDAVIAETASYLRVSPDRLILTNGLDEGILAATVACARGVVAGSDTARPEVIVPLPAFDMYGVCCRGVGATLVEVAPRPDLAFQLEAVLDAITTSTRLVFITSPNNPTGVRVPADAIARVAASVPPGALVFVDEAYHDFCGDTALPLVDAHPNVLVGRTFAKAHGLAALRAGCVIGAPESLRPLRLIVPPYSLNVGAVAGLRAAIRDDGRLRWYVGEVQESRRRVYAFCARHGIQYYESGANFVLLRIGGAAAAVVSGLAARGIAVRERTRDAGCEGCIRMTAGVVEHTDRALEALEEVLCDVR
jgi:histidinol-phosphate aminotransferase